MVRPEDKLPWFDAVCVVLPQLPYLMDECRRKNYRSANLLAGYCYCASEAIYHLSEDPLEPWWLRYAQGRHRTHWFLKHTNGDILDVTAAQFPDSNFASLYQYAQRRAFGTREPSKRAQAILDRVDRNVYFRRSTNDVKRMKLDEGPKPTPSPAP